ncbi:hypothetical protein NDU88_006183 [Pleurodeles waltl]|uniref:Uncharacterized protein n=1 Tax=Pleurodeles waltl TaxID=8319 RepID=A0AAV7LR70_PLEWA|nr:hypothetical protein NDU88_006183 [Pleurodeles waltl]
METQRTRLQPVTPRRSKGVALSGLLGSVGGQQDHCDKKARTQRAEWYFEVIPQWQVAKAAKRSECIYMDEDTGLDNDDESLEEGELVEEDEQKGEERRC